MLLRILLVFLSAFFCIQPQAQLIFFKDKIQSNYTIQDARATARYERIMRQAAQLSVLPIGNSEEASEPLEAGLSAVSQFLIKTPQSDSGISRLVNQFRKLAASTQRALLEAVYGLYPKEYYSQMIGILKQVSHPRNFAMAAAYIYRAHPTESGRNLIEKESRRLSTNNGQAILIQQLLKWINPKNNESALPNSDSLFAHQQVHCFKVIYSFQRKNRDYPGLAIIQNADGRFMRDSIGKLRVFRQLARSASNLPWFITNGSTPQGLYAITGTGLSRNVFIGPTPNLQMGMLHELNPPTFTHYFPPVFNAPPERLYRSYFPAEWQNWKGLMESYEAGRIGRSEIIAHGSTISPEWYKSHPFYPLTPTMGCLCALELWNPETGKIEQSDQLDLVNAFIETEGTKGYLMVINLNDKEGPVSAEELEELARNY